MVLHRVARRARTARRRHRQRNELEVVGARRWADRGALGRARTTHLGRRIRAEVDEGRPRGRVEAAAGDRDRGAGRPGGRNEIRRDGERSVIGDGDVTMTFSHAGGEDGPRRPGAAATTAAQAVRRAARAAVVATATTAPGSERRLGRPPRCRRRRAARCRWNRSGCRRHQLLRTPPTCPRRHHLRPQSGRGG